MKVKDLIERLKQYDQNMEVAYQDHDQGGYLAVKKIKKKIVNNDKYSSDWAFSDAYKGWKKRNDPVKVIIVLSL